MERKGIRKKIIEGMKKDGLRIGRLDAIRTQDLPLPGQFLELVRSSGDYNELIFVSNDRFRQFCPFSVITKNHWP